MGSLQATEILKEVMGIGESLAGHLLIYDALTTTMPQDGAQAQPALRDLRRWLARISHQGHV